MVDSKASSLSLEASPTLDTPVKRVWYRFVLVFSPSFVVFSPLSSQFYLVVGSRAWHLKLPRPGYLGFRTLTPSSRCVRALTSFPQCNSIGAGGLAEPWTVNGMSLPVSPPLTSTPAAPSSPVFVPDVSSILQLPTLSPSVSWFPPPSLRPRSSAISAYAGRSSSASSATRSIPRLCMSTRSAPTRRSSSLARQRAASALELFGCVIASLSHSLALTSLPTQAIEAAVALSYPEPENAGKFLGLWLSFRVLGNIIGGAINLGLNVHNDKAGKISTKVYIIFVVLVRPRFVSRLRSSSSSLHLLALFYIR